MAVLWMVYDVPTSFNTTSIAMDPSTDKLISCPNFIVSMIPTRVRKPYGRYHLYSVEAIQLMVLYYRCYLAGCNLNIQMATEHLQELVSVDSKKNI